MTEIELVFWVMLVEEGKHLSTEDCAKLVADAYTLKNRRNNHG